MKVRDYKIREERKMIWQSFKIFKSKIKSFKKRDYIGRLEKGKQIMLKVIYLCGQVLKGVKGKRIK